MKKEQLKKEVEKLEQDIREQLKQNPSDICLKEALKKLEETKNLLKSATKQFYQTYLN